MKKTLSVMMITGMLASATPVMMPVNEVSAASTVKQNVKASTLNVVVDGVVKKIPIIELDGVILYSLRDLSASLKMSFTFDAKTKTYTLAANGKKVSFKRDAKYINEVELAAPITVYNNRTYLELGPIINAVGGDVIQNETAKTTFIATKGLTEGIFTNAKWLNQNQILATSEDGSAIILDAATRKVNRNLGMAELVSSPNGKQGIYADENGYLFLLDYETGKTAQVSQDESFKAEFKWSADGSKIYFFQGDKNETISMLTLADGKITKLLDDKVEYKTDLVVSADGSKVLYSAAKQAVTKFTDDKNTDVETIITEGTEPQIFSFDLTAANAKPVAMTTTKENKFYTTLLSDGKILYLAEDVDKEDALPKLNLIAADGKTSTIVQAKQIELIKAVSNNAVYLLIAEENGSSTISKLDVTTGKLETKLNTEEEIFDFDVTNDGEKFVVTSTNGTIYMVQKGSLEALTKNE
jgi:Tol biopolymer transport system component